MVLLMVVGTFVVLAGLIALVVRVSGRGYPGQITTDKGVPVDYENPYGWGAALWTSKASGRRPEPARPPRTADQALAQWSKELD